MRGSDVTGVGDIVSDEDRGIRIGDVMRTVTRWLRASARISVGVCSQAIQLAAVFFMHVIDTVERDLGQLWVV